MFKIELEDVKKEIKDSKKESLDDKIESIVDKIEFDENYTARQWLSQLKAKYRANIRELLPGMFDAMKNKANFRKGDDLLDLPLKAFIGIMGKYNKTFGMTPNIDAFLG